MNIVVLCEVPIVLTNFGNVTSLLSGSHAFVAGIQNGANVRFLGCDKDETE